MARPRLALSTEERVLARASGRGASNGGAATGTAAAVHAAAPLAHGHERRRCDHEHGLRRRVLAGWQRRWQWQWQWQSAALVLCYCCAVLLPLLDAAPLDGGATATRDSASTSRQPERASAPGDSSSSQTAVRVPASIPWRFIAALSYGVYPFPQSGAA